MIYGVLADVVLVAHLAFIVFVGVGGFLVLWKRRLVWLHLPCAIWGLAIELGGWICPLTPLENRLRRLGGQAGYEGGFIEHYVLPVIYPAGLTRATQLWIAAIVVGLNVVAYALVWRRRSVGAQGLDGVDPAGPPGG